MTQKIAVSLPDDVVATARAAVSQGRAASVSAYVAGAMREHQRATALEELVADMVAEHGTPSVEDYAWADEVLAARPAEGGHRG